jgi:hypothetical protein
VRCTPCTFNSLWANFGSPKTLDKKAVPVYAKRIEGKERFYFLVGAGFFTPAGWVESPL